MTCLEAQALITRFIKEKLENKGAEEFLAHMKECKDCREELEVSFALLTAIYHLDQDVDFDGDYKQELDRKLQKLVVKLKKKRFKRFRNWIFLLVSFLFLSFGMQMNLEDVLLQKVREQELAYLNLIPIPEIRAWQNFNSRLLRVKGRDPIKLELRKIEKGAKPKKNRGYLYPETR